MTRSHAGAPAVVRGRIYGAVIEERGEKYYLAVSNNQRNARLGDFLAVRLTTSRKPPLPSIVHLAENDAPWVGAICCDDVEKVYRDEVTRDYGALPSPTLARVDDALRSALSL